MPRNGSGTASVLNSFSPNSTIASASVNANFVDVASDLTNSLPRDGQAGMTGQFKAAAGTVTVPGIGFSNDTDMGLYRIGGDNAGFACAGAKVLDISATGLDVTGALSATGTITKNGVAVEAFASGTVMLFVQSSAPTGWTKGATHNDKALRLVTGPASTGGSTAFTSVFAARTIAQANLPNVNFNVTDLGHTHDVKYNTSVDTETTGGDFMTTVTGLASGGAQTGTAAAISNTTGISVASGGSGTAVDFAVNYVDVILATKD